MKDLKKKKYVTAIINTFTLTISIFFLVNSKMLFLQKPAEMVNYGATEPVVILGFGEMGQVSCMIFLFLRHLSAYHNFSCLCRCLLNFYLHHCHLELRKTQKDGHMLHSI